MAYDVSETIAALAAASGSAARGIVRVSGPQTLDCLAKCFVARKAAPATRGVMSCRRIDGAMHAAGRRGESALVVPGRLFIWPGQQSYTRQPSAEFHTMGSAPLLAAVLDEICRMGARPARPGEFTLRAFLAGRLDLTQAEAVLGVVEAQTKDDLDAALSQLAGGLGCPLHALREQLLNTLAEIEAGLDFADEPLELLSREELQDRMAQGRRIVRLALAQLGSRDRRADDLRVVLTGPPNAGKSSLFNALVERYGELTAARSLVSPTPGATRDYVAATLNLDGLSCVLVDAAGHDSDALPGVGRAAQQAAVAQQRGAAVRLICRDAAAPDTGRDGRTDARDCDVLVVTKIDLIGCSAGEDATLLQAAAVGQNARNMPEAETPRRSILCSSRTGAGVDELARQIRTRLAEIESAHAGATSATAERCTASLREADRALAAAESLAGSNTDELAAVEIRLALTSLGEVVGAVHTDDLLDRIFSQFCIGK